MTSEQQVEQLSKEEIVSLFVSHESLLAKHKELEQQLSWLKKQLFGQKSEKRRYLEEDPRQLCLGEIGQEPPQPPKEPNTVVSSYERGKAKKKPLDGAVNESGLRFSSDVPVEVIEIPNPETEGLSEQEYEVVSEKVSHELAQEPGSYRVIKYVRKTIKLKESNALLTPAAAPSVIEKSFADVSFLAGMLIDKFLYYLPLFRQHQRLMDAGIQVSRATLTNLTHKSIELIKPIHLSQYGSILGSNTLCMDESPMKAGRKAKGKMNLSYFWPVYGDKDEICFLWCDSRAHANVPKLLDGFNGILLSDGYEAYENYTSREEGIIQAQCWNHSRRKFVDALEMEPELAQTALGFIGELYKNEEHIRDSNLKDERKLAYRVWHSKPVVERFFAWLEEALALQALLPSSPFTQAANYVFKREEQLKVFLRFPEVQIDTNHIERPIRSVAMARKNWNFCWTEIGAQYVGIILGLVHTCILHKVNPRHYLIDVLQRVDTHPQSQIHLLTPRLWKTHFEHCRLKAPLEIIREKKFQDTS